MVNGIPALTVEGVVNPTGPARSHQVPMGLAEILEVFPLDFMGKTMDVPAFFHVQTIG